ncbi:MAG TPA: SDR family oxidoreductase, partial [Elusimicrobiales bacterium]|nr:SDR family oxidoreductase [Elusimicrobiales bacterium]
RVAAACASRGARLIHVSTDYVFDGEKGGYSETDTPRPINVYGQSKLDAESRVTALCRDCAVARTAMVYSYNASSPNVAMQLLNNNRNNIKSRVATDMYANPTYAPDLAEMLIKLAESGKIGVFHATGPQKVSRLEFAQLACRILGLNLELLEPMQFAKLKPKAARPLDSSLEIAKLRQAIGHQPLGPEAGLKQFAKKMAEDGL